METPGNAYYVGLDMESAIHPQTLLAYEMNGQPLNWHHGAPLRLAIPVKYGIKNIKRIGTIRYSAVRPPDYWAKQGTTGTRDTERAAPGSGQASPEACIAVMPSVERGIFDAHTLKTV